MFVYSAHVCIKDKVGANNCFNKGIRWDILLLGCSCSLISETQSGLN